MGKKLLFSLLIVLLIVGALRALNTAFVYIVAGDSLWVALPLGTSLALVASAAAAWFASARSGHEVSGTLVAAMLFCLLGAGYAIYLTMMSVPRFGSAAVSAPGTIEENYARRGKHMYRVNSFGFRGPEWNPVKQPATVRGIVIGDSMVFGAGVDDADTIDAALADRLRRAHSPTRVEILNLGVVGSNLPNYVELYRAARERLMPDFVVLFLFLPNDLGELEQPSEEGRFGTYSLLKFLLGTNNNPYTFCAMRFSEARPEESKLAFLGHHIEAIERLRRSPLFVFLYHQDPRWTDTVRTHLGAGAWLVDHPPLPETDFIAGDGHPTPAGNRHFADIIGDAIDRSPAASVLFDLAP